MSLACGLDRQLALSLATDNPALAQREAVAQDALQIGRIPHQEAMAADRKRVTPLPIVNGKTFVTGIRLTTDLRHEGLSLLAEANHPLAPVREFGIDTVEHGHLCDFDFPKFVKVFNTFFFKSTAQVYFRSKFNATDPGPARLAPIIFVAVPRKHQPPFMRDTVIESVRTANLTVLVCFGPTEPIEVTEEGYIRMISANEIPVPTPENGMAPLLEDLYRSFSLSPLPVEDE